MLLTIEIRQMINFNLAIIVRLSKKGEVLKLSISIFISCKEDVIT